MKSNRPLVSICVPIYNAENYLPECLDSLVNQSLKNIEIICVNDGSTDNSPKILSEYSRRHKNIKVINQQNKGLGKTRDTGVKNATGEFIGFVDADDIVDREMFEKLYKLAKKNNAEVAFCNLSLFPLNSGSKKKIWYNPFNGELSGDFLYRNTQPWNKIFSHNLFDRLNAKFNKNDSLCTLLMVKANGIVSTDEKLYRYRVGHSSMSVNYKLESFIDTVNELDKIRGIIISDKKLKETLGEYFDFLLIDAIIKAMAIAVLKGNHKTYLELKKKIKAYKHYARNKYCKRLLKPEHGNLKYFSMMYILPAHYYASRILICGLLRGRI